MTIITPDQYKKVLHGIFDLAGRYKHSQVITSYVVGDSTTMSVNTVLSYQVGDIITDNMTGESVQVLSIDPINTDIVYVTSFQTTSPTVGSSKVTITPSQQQPGPKDQWVPPQA